MTMWLAVLAVVLAAVWYFRGEGGYMMAWAVSLLAAVVLLYVLSIPRRIVVDETAVEIRCIVELTRIGLDEIRNVRRIDRDDMRCRPVVVGSYGFFGYYGTWFDTSSLETGRIYCTSLDGGLVEITDIYEKRIVVNAVDPDAFVSVVVSAVDAYCRRAEVSGGGFPSGDHRPLLRDNESR